MFKVGDRVRFTDKHWSTITGTIVATDGKGAYLPDRFNLKIELDLNSRYVDGNPVLPSYQARGVHSDGLNLELIEEKLPTDGELAKTYRESMKAAHAARRELESRGYTLSVPNYKVTPMMNTPVDEWYFEKTVKERL